jgi:polysaccharide export outer membrane protein
MNLNPAGFYLNGYSINEEGNITLPEVGPVKVVDLTLNEAQTLIANEISEYLSTATVIVKLTSFKITVLGEVNSPGYYYVYNDQANLLEGLGLASDLTEFGNRENITLIRQTDDGSEVVLINLKDPDILSSKYYFLQPNDVIYVQPLKAKNTRSNLSTFTILSVLFGAISSTILLLRYLND